LLKVNRKNFYRQIVYFLDIFLDCCDQPVRLCVCPSISLNCWTDLPKIWCAHPLWQWLGPTVAALHDVMYFQFYGWHHVWPYSMVWHGRPDLLVAVSYVLDGGRVWHLWLLVWYCRM